MCTSACMCVHVGTHMWGMYMHRVELCVQGKVIDMHVCGCLHTHRMCTHVGSNTYVHVSVEASRPTGCAPACPGAHVCGHVPQILSNLLLPGLCLPLVTLHRPRARRSGSAQPGEVEQRGGWRAGCPVTSGLCPSLPAHSWASSMNSLRLSFVVCKTGAPSMSYKARKIMPSS